MTDIQAALFGEEEPFEPPPRLRAVKPKPAPLSAEYEHCRGQARLAGMPADLPPTTCRECGRVLRNRTSIAAQVGPVCAAAKRGRAPS